MRLLPSDPALGWMPYVWLVYSALFAGWPFVYGPGAFGWAPHLAGMVLFLFLYFRAHWETGWRRLGIALGIAALGAVLTPVNAGALMFFIYAASFVGEARAGNAAGAWIGGFTVAGTLAASLSPWWHPVLLACMAVFTPLIGFVNVAYAATRRKDVSLRLANAEIARLAAEAERHRIASDVHDVLGQSLTLLVLKADLAAKLLVRDQDAALREIHDIERMSRGALADVRRVVSGIRTASVAGEWQRSRETLAAAGVTVDCQPASLDRSNLGTLVPEVEHAVAMAVREAVTNVIRHAGATTCRLALSRDDARLRLEVTDNGRGGAFVEGAGLTGMRARLAQLGGSLECDSRDGTRLVAMVPIGPAGAAP